MIMSTFLAARTENIRDAMSDILPIPVPAILTIDVFSISVIALAAFLVFSCPSPISVPSSLGLSKFFTLIGIFFFITGSIALGWSTAAPK